jgi:hypothetical protein
VIIGHDFGVRGAMSPASRNDNVLGVNAQALPRAFAEVKVSAAGTGPDPMR